MLFVIEVDNDGFKVYDSAGNLIDPAKDQSIQSVLTALNAIKNTDGVKKITDPLPAGTNWIGKTAIGDGTDVLSILDDSGVKRLRVETIQKSCSFNHAILYDEAGHPIGVVLDGSIYRLQTDAKIAKGASDLVHLDAIDTAWQRD